MNITSVVFNDFYLCLSILFFLKEQGLKVEKKIAVMYFDRIFIVKDIFSSMDLVHTGLDGYNFRMVNILCNPSEDKIVFIM
jgi:DNA-binding LacI/PurR family transcriptional regulator